LEDVTIINFSTNFHGLLKMHLFCCRKYGIIGLYKGMEAKLLQTILTAALMFAAYEKIANFVFKLLLNHPKISSKLK
jgi:adenine nucleotide transporter 17